MLQEASLFNNLVSAKRTKNERQGVYAWHPYYAGYSEAFVRSAIKYLGLNSSDLLLDPWNGSGTTAFVASQFEIPTLGCEINPVMNVFSSAKSSYLIYQKEILINILEKITNLFSIFSTKNNQLYLTTAKIHDLERDKDPLLDFMSQSLCNGIRILYLVLEHIDYPKFDISQQLSNNLDQNSINFNPFLDFFKAALFITARQLAGYKGGSNPTTSYYLPNMLQYCNDAELSLREIIRVLKPNSKALIVVQSSYFKEHEINLGTIYVELCKNLGVRSEIVNREIIRSHMAHINTNSNKYKKKKVYLEDVVCITK